MFDWLSISTRDPDTWNSLSNSLLEFDKTSTHGELLFSEALYKGIKIVRYYRSNTVRLSFSPHKLFNELHKIVNPKGTVMNHDRFTPQALNWVFGWLNREFAVNPKNCRLHHIEFGFNLRELPISTSKILDCLIAYAYKGIQTGDMPVIGQGNGRQFMFTQYTLKFYDKSLQNFLPFDILRIEFKARKMQAVQSIFGKYPILIDLLNPAHWLKCKERLLTVIDYCVFDDQFLFEQDENLAKWRNPRVWKNMSSLKRSRDRKKFDQLIEKQGQLKIKQILKEAVEVEFVKMLPEAVMQ